MHRFIILIYIFLFIYSFNLKAQASYGYGTVIGGQISSSDGVKSTNYLNENEEGVRVVFIQSRGSGLGVRNGGGGSAGGGVQILDVPKDTDYLELIMFYSRLDPRGLRRDKIKILRVASTGQNPYISKNIQRYWTTYNFGKQYDRGGPFDLVRPYDIIIVQQRGLFNREFFDPITDINFLLTLPTFIFSIVTVYNTFIK